MEACGDTDVRIVRYAWRKRAIDQPLVSLRTAETEQLQQGKRMIGGIGDMFLSNLFSHLKMGKIQKFFFGEPLKHVITIRGQILASRTDDDPLPPCVPRTCFNTCARGAGTHGDVLNVHTEAFLKPNTGFSTSFFSATQHTNTQTHTDTQTHTKHTPRPPTPRPQPRPRPQRHIQHTARHQTQHHTETETRDQEKMKR